MFSLRGIADFTQSQTANKCLKERLKPKSDNILITVLYLIPSINRSCYHYFHTQKKKKIMSILSFCPNGVLLKINA